MAKVSVRTGEDDQPLHTRTTGDSVETQAVVLGIDASDAVIPADSSNGLSVRVTNGSIPVTDNGGSLTVDGTVAVTDGGGSITVDGSVGVTAALSSPAGVRLSDGTSAIGSTAQRLWIDDGGSSVSVDDNGGSLTVDGTVSLGSGSAAIGRVDIGSALPAGTNNIGDVDVLTLPSLPAGSNAIGKLAANSGVDIGDVDVTSISAGSNAIGNVGLIGRTSGGLSMFLSIDLDETEEDVKTSAGQVFGYYFANLHATAWRYVKLYNATAANVTVGTTTPVRVLPLPPNSAGHIAIPQGLAFSTAISAAATTGVANNDTGAPGTNEVVINIDYV